MEHDMLDDEFEERRSQDLSPQRLALNTVLKERDKQRGQWGPEHDREHDVTDWHTILSVYLGKLGYETPLYQQAGFDKEKAKKRLVQISAIALAAVEALSVVPESTGTE